MHSVCTSLGIPLYCKGKVHEMRPIKCYSEVHVSFSAAAADAMLRSLFLLCKASMCNCVVVIQQALLSGSTRAIKSHSFAACCLCFFDMLDTYKECHFLILTRANFSYLDNDRRQRLVQNLKPLEVQGHRLAVWQQQQNCNNHLGCSY